MNNVTSTLDILLQTKEENIRKAKRARRRLLLRRRRLESEVK